MSNNMNIIPPEGLVKEKELSMLGVKGQPGLNEWFMNVGHGDLPDVGTWLVLADGTGTVECKLAITDLGECRVIAGNVGDDDSSITTIDLIHWSPGRTDGDVNSLHFKSSFRIVDLTGEACLGLIVRGYNQASQMDTVGAYAAGIHLDNDVMRAISSDVAVVEETDISGHFTDDTDVILEVILTLDTVKFYVDEVLRASHDTNIPLRVLQAIAASKNTNAVLTELDLSSVQVWTEK